MSFDPNDFIALVSSTDATETETLVRKIFDSVDTDKSGLIDVQEMYNMMKTFVTYCAAG